MKIKNLSVFFMLVTAPFAGFAQSVSVDVELNPAGNFKAETKQVTGAAYRTPDGGYAAENIVVDIRNLETGVSLRDKHTRKRLGAPKYSHVKLLKATGKNGKGEATIQVMDKTQKVAGTYKVNGNMLEAQFPMSLSELGIKDVSYMGIGVEDKVTVHVTVPIKDAPAKVAAAAPAKAAPQAAAKANARKPASAKGKAKKSK